MGKQRAAVAQPLPTGSICRADAATAGERVSQSRREDSMAVDRPVSKKPNTETVSSPIEAQYSVGNTQGISRVVQTSKIFKKQTRIPTTLRAKCGLHNAVNK